MENVYLQLDWKTAKFFEHSAEEKIGFEPHTNTKDVVSYRRYHNDGVIGTYLGTEVRDSKIGQRIQSSWQVHNTVYKAQIPMLSPGGEFTDYAESFIRTLSNLVKGTQYRMYPYFIEKDAENKYEKRGISFKEGGKEGEKVPPLLSYAADAPAELQIPRLVWKERMGKKAPSAASVEAKFDFLAEWLEKFTSKAEAPAQEYSKVPVGEDMELPSTNKNPVPQGEDDDLPF